jgi:predicted alpha/beta hydrolase
VSLSVNATAVLAHAQAVALVCSDGVQLGAHFWPAQQQPPRGRVIINPATGVLARYYHRYARFLAGHGYDVLTYDYRGIGASRPASLKGCSYRWVEWGTHDFEAALQFMLGRQQATAYPLLVVGHSIGGFLIGLAPSACHIDRILTVGAQFAWCGDYAARHRLRLFLKWHVVMPALTAVYGYFPGRRLGWLEDLPQEVALEWSFRGPRFERTYKSHERGVLLERMAAVRSPILAINVADDDIATERALARTLRYYTNAQNRQIMTIHPAQYGRDKIGHFKLFHDSHAADFWPYSLQWLENNMAGEDSNP